MANQAGNARKFWIVGGAVAVGGVAAMIALDYPPSAEDTSGTIVPAKRFRADGGGTTLIGDSTAIQGGNVAANGTDAAINASADAALNAGVNAAGAKSSEAALNAAGAKSAADAASQN